MPKYKMIILSKYREMRFVAGYAPDTRTLKKLIDDGKLDGKQIGKNYFVKVDKDFVEYDEQLERLLNHD